MSKVVLTNLLVRFYGNGLYDPAFDGTQRTICNGCVMLPKAIEREQARAIVDAVEAAQEGFFGSKTGWPSIGSDRKPLRDGDCEDWNGFEGNWYLSFRTNQIVDQAPKKLYVPPFVMATGEFEFSVGYFRGYRVYCKPLSITEKDS